MGKKSIRNRSRSDIGVSKLRSAITNGTRMLADLDHRGAWARRLKDLIGGQVADLGGEEMVSEGKNCSKGQSKDSAAHIFVLPGTGAR